MYICLEKHLNVCRNPTFKGKLGICMKKVNVYQHFNMYYQENIKKLLDCRNDILRGMQNYLVN